LIDLHTHTTASDGRRSPEDLVALAASAGVTVLAVTDHDTVASCALAAAACASRGITFVPGIEITAICDGADVHVLGYWIDPTSADFLEFLEAQRAQRVERVRTIVAKLAALGMPLDADDVLAPFAEDPRRTPGRPWIAAALTSAGYTHDIGDAFDRFLSRGRPAFVPRLGAPPPDVIARIHAAGGVASLAHPILVGRDEWIDAFAAQGLDALEAYHSKQDAAATAHYTAMAERLGLAVSGGSDYHGEPTHGPHAPGAVTLPREQFDRLAGRRPITREG
jgi:predicted metal-dependent phosphoesterase TrpH